jgi:hypothetical protein
MLILLITVLVYEGISVLALMAFVFLFDFGILFCIQTHLVLKNRTAVDKGELRGNFDIYKSKSMCDNWQSVFTANVFSWFLPFGKPDILQALDYDADIQAGGLLEVSGAASDKLVVA